MVTGADMNCGPGQNCTTLFILTTTQLTASGHTEKPPVLAHTHTHTHTALCSRKTYEINSYNNLTVTGADFVSSALHKSTYEK